MEKLRVLYDREGETLTIWWGDPRAEVVCDNVGDNDDVILMMDADGRVIGVEKLHVPLAPGVRELEVQMVPDKRTVPPT
jgi:uncharacterized protein YuzE